MSKPIKVKVDASKEKNYSIEDLVSDACDEFDEVWDGDSDEDGIMHEIADNAVPIYYWDIAQYAAHNTWLMTQKPEINTDGNAHDQIQANIYEHIVEGLNYHVAKKEREEDDE